MRQHIFLMEVYHVWNNNCFIKYKSEVYMDYKIRELKQNEIKILDTFCMKRYLFRMELMHRHMK